MGQRYRLLVSLEVQLLDPTWDLQTLRENFPTFLAIATHEGQPCDPGGPYQVNDLTVWYNERVLKAGETIDNIEEDWRTA